MNKIKNEIMKVLLPGEHTAITAGEIAERIGHAWGIHPDDTIGLEEQFGGKTYLKIRRACKSLLHDHQKPVLSCRKGFYIAEEEEELQRYEENISARIKGLQKNFNAIRKVREKWGLCETLFDMEI